MKTSSLKFSRLAAGILLISGAATFAVPVTFKVDMATAPFIPGTDTVEARGEFQSPSAWSGGFALTNVPATTIYAGTYNVTNAVPGTQLEYKFAINNGTTWEANPNRTFILSATAQTLPPVHFNRAAAPSGTNSVTFQVDLSALVTAGLFLPGTDAVEARGTFQSPSHWTGGFTLTNNGGNVYVGTYTNDGNYDGNVEEFKFVMITNGVPTFESIPFNRQFILSNGLVLPVVRFNDFTIAPVTFRVDMTAPVLLGTFTNGVNAVEVRGSFNSWFEGIPLTNSPTLGGNTNLYYGTFPITNISGSGVAYKFHIVTPDVWENRGDRVFATSTNAQTLTDLWEDKNAHDLLLAPSAVTFKVNMTGAVGLDGHVFDASSDIVYLNGNWYPWWGWNQTNYTDPLNPWPGNVNQPTHLPIEMTESPLGSSNYTVTVTIPAGSYLNLIYKFSINGYENEGGFAVDHVRYVRRLGSYTLPVDQWRSMVVESSHGNLAASAPTAGKVPLTWIGRPGVILQTSPAVGSAAVWSNLPETEGYGSASGIYSTNYPAAGSKSFFRLKQL